MRIVVPIGLLASLYVAACGDGPTAPPPGAIRVQVFTTGGDQDPDGYELFVGAEKRVISTTGTVNIHGFNGGSHLVELKGVASNCSVLGDNPRAVVVEPGGVVSATIEVVCDSTGIELEFRTVAPETPIVGYTVRAAGRALVATPNGFLTFSGLPPGSHVVSLTLPETCSVPGGSTFPVTVADRRLTHVAVEITCVRNPNTIAFSLDTIINRSFTRFVAVGSATEGELPTTLFAGFDPAWSRDGKKLAYSTTYCDDYYALWRCTGGLSIVDFSTGAQFTSGSFLRGLEPAWSPDGAMIAFIELSPNFVGRLRVAGADGSASPLPPLDVLDARRPSWSPDGNRIAFECRMTPNPMNADICLVNRDGSGFVRLTTDTTYQGDPAWRPDGSRLAFTSTSAGDTWIMLMKPDGTDVRQVVPGREPAWSPDGSRLAFVRNDGVFIAGVDGSSVTRASTGTHRAPSWRP